jgi:uncharacterized protein (TIGR00251 family)
VTYASTRDGALFVDVQVVTRSAREGLGPVVGDRIKARVNAAPVDGEANRALVLLVSKLLDVRRDQIEIVRGETGRKKTLRIAGGNRERLEAALADSAEGGEA